MKLIKQALIALLCISLAPIIMTMQNIQRLQPAARQVVRRGGAQAPQLLNARKNIAPSSWSVLKPAARQPIAAHPQRNYRNYQDDYGNLAEAQPQYQKPFDIRPFAGVSLAATLAALQQKQAESLASEYTLYEYVNAKGYRKKVIFLGDSHLEDVPQMREYIDNYRKNHAAQALGFLVDLKQTANPVTFFIETAQWEIGPQKEAFQYLQKRRQPFKMGAMTPAIIEAVLHNMEYDNITYVPFDKRSKSVVDTLLSLDKNKKNTPLKEFLQITGLTFEQRDAWLHNNLAKTANSMLYVAQKIINNAGLSPEIKEVLEKINHAIASSAETIAAQPFDYGLYKAAYFDCARLETDTALACDLYNALEREGDETIVIQSGKAHLMIPTAMMRYLVGKPAEKVNKDAQNNLMVFTSLISHALQDPARKAKLVKAIPDILSQEYLDQQKAVSPDEILGAYILDYVQQNTVTDFRTPLSEFLKK